MKRRLLLLLFALSCLPATLPGQDHPLRVTRVDETHGYGQEVVVCGLQDSYGFMWFGTWNGLCRYDGYQMKNYRMRPGDRSPLRTNHVCVVRELPDHEIECEMDDGMVCVFHRRTETFEMKKGKGHAANKSFQADSQTIRAISSLPELKGREVRFITRDRQDGIWVFTYGGGLYRVWRGTRGLQTRRLADGSEEWIRALYADRRRRLWIAGKNGFVKVGGQFLSSDGALSKSPRKFGLMVYCFFQDSNGNMWLGTRKDGLLRLVPDGTGKSFKVSQYAHNAHDRYSLSNNAVYAIAEDSRKRLWIGTLGGGLNMLDLHQPVPRFVNKNNTLRGWTADKGGMRVRCLHVTPKGVLLAGTMNGLYTSRVEADPSHMTFHHNTRRLDDATSLSHYCVLDIEPADPRTLVLATDGGGLCLANSDSLLTDHIRFGVINSDKGLPSDMCMSVLRLAEDSLCIVARKSISILSLRDTTFTNFASGIDGDDFSFLDVKPVVGANGRFLFGTTQGVLDVSRDDLRKSNYSPQIVVYAPDTIHLSADEQSLSIRFAAIDYDRNVPITYAYRIDGMGSRWTYVTDNAITLPNVPAGTWKLRLRSTNGDGVWCDNERVLIIHRPPHFAETPYPWLLLGLMLAFMALVAYKVAKYIRRLQNEMKDMRLTSSQRVEVMASQIRELLNIREKVVAVGNIDAVMDSEPSPDQKFAQRLKQYLLDNISNSDLSVADIAKEMGVSNTVLYVRTKSVLNTTPNNYLLNLRIEKAKALLGGPNPYIAEIAYACGFSDPRYFSRCFKKLTGVTPTEYSKQMS